MPKNNISTIVLGLGRSLIIPDLPPALDLAIISNQPKLGIDTSKFGLFDSASPNLAQYYPDATPEDLKPKNEDFIYPVFRALSEVVVHKEYNPVDFTQNGVLKKSLSMLIGQTIYANHEMVIGNELGVVQSAVWQNSYKTDKGIIIPAGINARLMIDGKKVPGIVRSIQMDPPAIHSVSVTLQFAWQKSHDISDDEFRNKLGTYDEKGNLYTRVATEIIAYKEISLVPHGADPFAKKVGNDGKIIKPEEAAKRNGTLKNSAPRNHFFDFSGKTDLILNSEEEDEETATLENLNDNNDTNKNKNMNRDFLLQLAFICGMFDVTSLSDEDLTKKVREGITTLADANKSNIQLTADVLRLTKELAEKTVSLTVEQTKNIAAGEKYITTLKNEAITNHKLITGTDDAAFIERVNGSDLAGLEAIKAENATKLEEKSPLTCGDCSSTNVSRQTAVAGQGKNKTVNLSAEAALEEISKEALKGFKSPQVFSEVD